MSEELNADDILRDAEKLLAGDLVDVSRVSELAAKIQEDFATIGNLSDDCLKNLRETIDLIDGSLLTLRKTLDNFLHTVKLKENNMNMLFRVSRLVLISLLGKSAEQQEGE